MVKFLVGVAAFVPYAAASKDATNPLGQVLALMDELATKVAKEGEVEQAAYEEYFEWCDDVNKNSHFAIKTATDQKAKLEAKIGELAANIKAGASKIEDLVASISSGTDELKAATAVREKEAATFAASEKELMETIDTLQRAVKIISKEMNKNPAAFLQGGSADFRKVIQTMSTVVEAAGFSATDQHRLAALVQQSDSDEDGELGAPAAAAYESKSGGIVDTLEDLKEKAETELSELRKAETTAKHNYEMLAQSLQDQLDADNKDLAEEKAAKTAAEEDKATAEGDLAVTSDALATAQEELATANKNCMQVAADHGASVASRAEELKVIAEAKKIVADSTSGAEGQTYSLLQVSSAIRSGRDLARHEVLTLVKRLAKKEHSAALAQLVSRITAVVRYGGSSGDDPFVKIKGLITDMISKLENEAAEAANEKAFCDEEMAKTKAKKDDLTGVADKLSATVDQDTARSAELKGEVKELEEELAALAKEQAEMDQMRQKNHAEFVQAKKDLELGLSGVRKALGVLREYYGGSSAALLQDDQPAMPKTHSKSGGAGGSIINLLEVCESDFASNLAKEETEEATRAEAYDQNTQENKVTKTAKESDVKYKTKEAVGLDKKVSELSKDLETTNTELAAVNEYWSKITGRCVAKPETYEERKRRREAEINGLKEALSILENESAFVQRGGKRRKHMRGSSLSPA